MINLAILGLGGWGKRLVATAQENSSTVKFTHAVTRTPAKVESFAQEQNLALSDRMSDALDNPDIDGVVVAGPAQLHGAVAAEALAASKHVMTIKPLSLRRDEAEALREAAAKKKLVLAMGYDRCFLPAADALRAHVTAGDLGDIVHAEGNFCAARYFDLPADDWKSTDENAPPGSLADHMLYTMIELMGLVQSLSVQARTHAAKVPISDTAHVSLQFASGATGGLTAIGITPQFERLHVFGTKGWAEIRNSNRLEFKPLTGDSVVTEFPAANLLLSQLDAFGSAIAGDKPYPVTPEKAVNGAAVLDAMLRAKNSGEIETV